MKPISSNGYVRRALTLDADALRSIDALARELVPDAEITVGLRDGMRLTLGSVDEVEQLPNSREDAVQELEWSGRVWDRSRSELASGVRIKIDGSSEGRNVRFDFSVQDQPRAREYRRRFLELCKTYRPLYGLVAERAIAVQFSVFVCLVLPAMLLLFDARLHSVLTFALSALLGVGGGVGFSWVMERLFPILNVTTGQGAPRFKTQSAVRKYVLGAVGTGLAAVATFIRTRYLP